MRFRQALLRAVLAVAAVTLVLAGPSFGVRGATPSKNGILRDFARSGALQKPTSAQRAAVRALHAKATWNNYGTAATLMRPGGFLTKKAAGKTAAIAARSWLSKHRVIFRLSSVRGLVLAADSKLSASRGHAVTFQQAFKGLKLVNGEGTVTVAISPAKANRWKIAFVSSTVIGSVQLKGAAKISAAQAWVHAAGNAGLKNAQLVNVKAVKVARGWINLRVGGLPDIQRVRLGAFGLSRHTAVPAFETIVLDRSTGTPAAYRVIVDARTGKALARANLVDYFSGGNNARITAPITYNFSGAVPATDGACDVMQGPYTVGAGVRALDGFAAATVPTNDMVLKLFFGSTLLISADTLFSPEQFHYEPAGGVPPGDYFVQVCDFAGGGPWADPRDYTGHLTVDDTPAPPPYLARWKAFPANPPLSALDMYPWNHSSTDTRQTFCWRAADGCDLVIGNLASRAPWDFDLHANSPTFTTSGNNNKAATSWANDTVPSSPQYMPVSLARDYSFPWTNDWNTRQCQRAATETPGTVYDDSAAATNLFVMHNRMHDFSYFLGFTEQNWNAQASNFGLTELRQENDPLVGDVQSGAQTTTRDNANMITLPDGASSITNMYFWQPLAGSFYSPCVDGDYDQSVIGHEFGHMIENRMIGKGNTRAGFHAGAMGEAFGDLDGIEYLVESGFEDSYVAGAYATGNKEHGIRNYVMNWPRTGAIPAPATFPHVDPLNFSDIGYDTPGNEVHSDGEIWVAINNTVRQGLVDKYNGSFPASDTGLQAQCEAGELPSQNCPGNRRWIQLYYDSMLLDPTAPTMIDARNSILAADMMRYGGANQTAIWHAFALRGLGQNAAVHPAPPAANRCTGTPIEDCDPVPDFSSPLDDNATVTFNLVSKDTGDPVVGNVYVGNYENRVSPVADTDPATVNSGIDVNRDATAAFAPGRYDFIAVAKGYGAFRFSATFNAHQTKTQNVVMPTNWASAQGGATATGDGTTPGAAIDETETTNWNADGRAADGTLSGIAGKQITIDLAGTAARRVTDVAVSAMIAPTQSRFSALRSFELWACNAAAGADCSTDAGFTKVYTSSPDAFPGDAPRPNGPQLILRDFPVPSFRATHVRLRVLTSQCTGGPAYQGEQDADPTATTDCDTNVSAASTRRFVRTAEIQVFSSTPNDG
ncbi:MAG TPA: M36 family metallopeptidase [Gaiellaceae bacterium]